MAARRAVARRLHALCRTLDLLWHLLGEQREMATCRLLRPLSKRLSHYLALLFSGADLRLDENLLPVALARADAEDTLAALSFGTCEQLGLLARLAYADLLRQAGRPTMLVLDDAFVHADGDRRERIKRALFDAATRYQILLFYLLRRSLAGHRGGRVPFGVAGRPERAGYRGQLQDPPRVGRVSHMDGTGMGDKSEVQHKYCAASNSVDCAIIVQ